MLKHEELEVWLGTMLSRLDAHQVARLYAEAQDIERRWPGEEYAPEREAAVIATAKWLLGETTAQQAGAALIGAWVSASLALAAARQTARMAVIDGAAEDAVCRDAGVDPITVRKDLGQI